MEFELGALPSSQLAVPIAIWGKLFAVVKGARYNGHFEDLKAPVTPAILGD